VQQCLKNIARSIFCDRFVLKYKQSLAVVDCTHFKRKRPQKIDRATFCTEWKSALKLVLYAKKLLMPSSDAFSVVQQSAEAFKF
jgi:hypothetical protein